LILLKFKPKGEEWELKEGGKLKRRRIMKIGKVELKQDD